MKVAFLLPFLLGVVTAFYSPYDRSMSLPYGRQLRAFLSGKIPRTGDATGEDETSWWNGLDRNNTIDCHCGLYNSTTDPEKLRKWASEGVQILHEYPWSVSLVSSEEGLGFAFCGGTLISDRFVLTSAVCADGFFGEELDVVVGTWPKGHLEESPKNGSTEEITGLNLQQLIRKKVHRVIVHPKYVPNILDYNIALLRLKGPVPFYGIKDGVSPVCLPDLDFSYDGFESSSLFWRFYNEDGYIIPEKRTEVDSQILGKDECKRYAYNKEWGMMPDTMMCAKIEIPANLTNHPYYDSYDCPGDAGGPLLTTIDGRKVQVGIDSWTACYGRPEGVGVYTRIQEFMKWIKLHISEDGRLCAHSVAYPESSKS